jgi:tetratricopeptide (TPR) repeat protein
MGPESPPASGAFAASFRQAMLLHRQGRLADALAALAHALSLEPGNMAAHSARARLLGEAGRLEEALACLDEALARQPQAPALLGDRGNVLRLMKRREEALASYERALEHDPGFAGAHGNRGIVLRDLGRLEEALESFDRAIALKPDFASAFCNKALALIDLGRYQQAAQCCERAIALQPGVAAAHQNRALALRGLRLFEEALAGIDRAIACQPRHATAHADRGAVLGELRRFQEAVASYDRALALAPQLFEAQVNRGAALNELGRHEEALASCDQALAQQADSVQALCNRARALAGLGRFEEALGALDKALAVDPACAAAHNDRGNALRELDRFDEALASFERALAVQPGLSQALANEGLLLMELGRGEEARGLLERAVQADPGSARLHYVLANAVRMAPGDPRLAPMEALAREADSLDVESRVWLFYALSKAYDDLGERERSTSFLQQGAALKRSTLPYDEAATLGALERTRTLFSRELLSGRQGEGFASDLPVFIVGMPRSGTTLVEQILASHPEAHGAGEIGDFSEALRDLAQAQVPPAAFPELARTMPEGFLRRLGADYVERIRKRAPQSARIANKEVGNFRYVGLIHLALPGARILHVRRDPMDTCFSCYSHLFVGARLPYTYDLRELARYHRAFDALMAHWAQALPADAILQVQYEALVGDPQTQSRRIVEHCGLRWDARCLDFHETRRHVRTASLAQVRRPIYAASVGRWRAYEEFLRPLQAQLQEGATR